MLPGARDIFHMALLYVCLLLLGLSVFYSTEGSRPKLRSYGPFKEFSHVQSLEGSAADRIQRLGMNRDLIS